MMTCEEPPQFYGFLAIVGFWPFYLRLTQKGESGYRLAPGKDWKMFSEWERSDTLKGIPFYIDHKTEQTFWDHPFMTKTYLDLRSFDFIKYAAYRVACKLRSIQKATSLFMVELKTLRDYFEIRNLGVNADVNVNISVPELAIILEDLYVFQARKQIGSQLDSSECAEFALNWLLNVYNKTRLDFVSLISVKIGLALTVFGSVPAKYHYIFNQLKNTDGMLDRERLQIFMNSCLLIPSHFEEGKSFSMDCIESSIQQCLDQGETFGYVSFDEFMKWVMADPQALVWIPTLHRFSVAETTKHEAKCNVCKIFPIVGFRYKCLKCFNVDLCQECFWTGRVWKRHKLSHPIQEYCQGTKQGEDIKDIARIMKNKMLHGGKSDEERRKRFLPLGNEEPSPDQKGFERAPDSHSHDYDPVNGIESVVNEATANHQLKQHRQDSKKSNTSSKLWFSRRSSVSSFGQASSTYNEYLMPDDKNKSRKEERKEERRQPNMRSDQVTELEKVISTLEYNNSLMEKRLEEMRQQQIDFHSRTTLNEIRSLQGDKATLAARQEILEEHNRVLEMQLLKLRMLLQQKKHDEELVSRLPSSIPKLQGSDITVIVAPTTIDDFRLTGCLTKGNALKGRHYSSKQEGSHTSRTLTSATPYSYSLKVQDSRTRENGDLSVTSAIPNHDEGLMRREVEKALAHFPSKDEIGAPPFRSKVFHFADEVSKRLERTFSEDVYRCQDV